MDNFWLGFDKQMEKEAAGFFSSLGRTAGSAKDYVAKKFVSAQKGVQDFRISAGASANNMTVGDYRKQVGAQKAQKQQQQLQKQQQKAQKLEQQSKQRLQDNMAKGEAAKAAPAAVQPPQATQAPTTKDPITPPNPSATDSPKKKTPGWATTAKVGLTAGGVGYVAGGGMSGEQPQGY